MFVCKTHQKGECKATHIQLLHYYDYNNHGLPELENLGNDFMYLTFRLLVISEIIFKT